MTCPLCGNEFDPKKILNGAKSFGERIKILRTRLGMTQSDLAIKSGVSAQNISAYEQEIRHAPNLRYAKKICMALGVSIDVVAGDDL